MTTPQQYQSPAPPPAAGPTAPAAPAAPSALQQQQRAGNRPHFGHAMLSEWTKIRSVRSTVWTLSVMFAVVIGVDLLIAYGMSAAGHVQIPALSPGLFGLMLGQICVVTLGVLVVTSEYTTGMVRTTMTACPQRERVLLAKALVFFLVAFVTTTVACSLTALINAAMLDGTALEANSGQWLGATVGAGLYVALLGLLSLAVGALLRHSAGAITTMLGVLLLPIVMSIAMVTESLQTVREKMMEYSPLNGLASLYRLPMSADLHATGWPLLGLLAGVTLVALASALAVLRSRDV